jgi:2-polyprenyl-6-methoxyphenol hydroxylase-like FAD-dependent oxidoreductase
MGLHLTIIGGGIAGLCLAQGLRKAGISIAVYEKGPRHADRHWQQGYQIHINPSGSRAPRDCLPPAVWDSLAANACAPDAERVPDDFGCTVSGADRPLGQIGHTRYCLHCESEVTSPN